MNCDLSFFDIKKVSFKATGPFNRSECLEISFQDSSGEEGKLCLFFEEGTKIEIKNLKPLQKLKKIVIEIGKIRLKKRRKM